jgi:predicted phosphodiesterase
MSQCSVCAKAVELGIVVDESRSKKAWGAFLDVDESSVRRHLKHGDKPVKSDSKNLGGESETHTATGSSYVRFSEKPWGFNDYREFIRTQGQDPDAVTFTWGWTSNPVGGFWNKLNNVRPIADTPAGALESTDDLWAAIDSWSPTAVPRHQKSDEASTLVVCAADLQAGKTDYGLKSTDLAKRVLDSFAKAAEIATETRFREIVIADLGDIVENINSTSSQRATNDLAITEQIRLARRLMLEGIKLLAPLTDSLVYVAVPSNHGSVRIGPKSPENHVLDDYGIEIAEQLRDICGESDKLSNVTIRIPETSMESLCIETSGTSLGFAHGHQAQGPDGLGKFWQGQSHGRMPLAAADIALFGHFHSFRVQQSGDARWLMVGPASDNGSSWFTNKTGERSQAGMLSFVTADGAWSDLKIL